MTRTLTTIQPPTEINACKVLAARPLTHDHTSLPGHIVLCERRPGAYVTWTIGTEDGGRHWSAFWGHYFDEAFQGDHDPLAEAVEDYRTRRS